MPDDVTRTRALYRYPDEQTCSIAGCEKHVYVRGWCRTHYNRWHEHGDPLTVLSRATKRVAAPEEERFWKFVDTSGDCLIWTGAVVKDYGVFGVGSIRKNNRRPVKAHNFAYCTVVGPIPDGLVLDHLCRTPLCVYPAHLEPVTSRENTLRGNSFAAVNARKTHCPQGHEYAGDNLTIAKNGQRVCRTCSREATRQSRERKRAREQ